VSFALSCIGKWLLVPVTAVGFIIGVLAVVVVLGALLVGFLYLPVWISESLKVRYAKYADFLEKTKEKRDRAADMALTLFICFCFAYVAGVLGYAQVLGKNGWFPCDECLPESWQSACAADREAAEAKDRASFERMCATWEWAECKAVVP
jgi:hypothetical protein